MAPRASEEGLPRQGNLTLFKVTKKAISPDVTIDTETLLHTRTTTRRFIAGKSAQLPTSSNFFNPGRGERTHQKCTVKAVAT